MALTNWGGHYRFTARTVHRPSSLDELCAIVAAADRVSAIGSRHSFAGVSDSGEELVQLDRLAVPVTIDPDQRLAQVSAAVEVGAMARQIAAAGWALENLPGLPNMTLAGACATATHGSGDGFGALSTLVASVTLVTHDGDVVTITRGDDRFPAVVVSLGAAGVVVSMALDLIDDYEVRQTVDGSASLGEVIADLDGVMASATRVSVFVDPPAWRGEHATTIVRKQSLPRGAGGLDDDFEVPPGSGVAMTFDRDREGSWARLLPHFVYPSLPDAASEIQSEYFVERRHGPSALEALRASALPWDDHLVTAEVRTVARDLQWLSPFRRGDALAIHFTWRGHPAAVASLARAIEDVLAPFDPLPHWGKVFAASPAAVGSRYGERERARSVYDELDPSRTFRTPFAQEVLGE